MILIMYLIFLIVICLAITTYILHSIGLKALADKRGIENSWLAYVPIVNLYILGMLVGEMYIGTLRIPNLELILPIGSLVVFANMIPFFGQIISLLFAVVLYFAYYNLYRQYKPDDSVLYIILTIVLQLQWLFVFLIRNEKRA